MLVDLSKDDLEVWNAISRVMKGLVCLNDLVAAQFAYATTSA